METQAYWDLLINKSACRFFLLASLAGGPMHGYQLGKAVETATGACCTPSAAMIYPAIRELMEGGFITCESERVGGRERKVCALTPKGMEAYRTAARSWQRIMPYLQRAVDEAFVGVGDAPMDACCT